MFEFQKICNTVEALTPEERVALIADKSVEVIDGLHKLDLPGIDPVDTVAAFIIGSVISDGSVSEKDYLNIAPALEQTFGELCDLAGIRRKLKVSSDVRKEVNVYTRTLNAIIASVDEQLGADIVLLCLLITSVDGKVSLREKQYIKQLCSF